MSETQRAAIVRWRGASAEAVDDELAREEPLEIRVDGRAVSVTMRTPGHDEELAVGFLLSEGLIRGRSDVVDVAPVTQSAECNTVDVRLRPGLEVDFERLSRHVFASSSCGLCGKATIEAIRQSFPQIVATAMLLFTACLATAPDGVDAVESPATVETEAGPYLRKYCVECHDAASKSGGLNLEQLGYSMAGRAATELWTRIYDRIDRGEMPPPDGTRPTAAETTAFLGTIRPALAAADRAGREVVQRRLNRVEYQNTIRDLLAIDVDLIRLLPEDQQAGGFDNNGEALAVSTEQMQGYLEAARRAIDEAIVEGERPKTETFQVDSVRETKQYFGQGTYDYVDGRVVLHTSADNADYSKISTRDKKVPVRGPYRFRFQAVAHDSPVPLSFTVTAALFAPQGVSQRNVGYFEVGAVPQTFEIETTMEKGGVLQFFALGLPTYIKKKPDVVYPGVGFGEVEVTGPLYEQWPPGSTERLFPRGIEDSSTPPGEALTHLFTELLPRAFRRPVTDEEVARIVGISEAELAAGRVGNHLGVRLPQFGIRKPNRGRLQFWIDGDRFAPGDPLFRIVLALSLIHI
mgnify:CR=1 FL=1